MLLALGLVLWLRSEPPPREPEQLCQIFREKPAWYRQATHAAWRWRFSVPALMGVVLQESSYVAHARPQRERLLGFIPWKRPSSAYGYAQVVDATWLQYESAAGEDRSRRSFAHAIDFVGWYLARLSARLDLPRDDLERLYLAYHEGPGGYRRGSFRDKPGLRRAATRVARRVAHYEVQLSGCRAELDRAWAWHTLRLAGLGAAALAGAWWLLRRSVRRLVRRVRAR